MKGENNMKFVITRTSDNDYIEVKEFSTLEELIDFRNEVGQLVISRNFWYNAGKEGIENIKKWYPNINAEEIVSIPNGIEIYDSYRE